MQDDYTTNSHYPHLYNSLYKVGRMYFLNLWVKGLNVLDRALENTLRLMNGRNETYRKSFNKVDEMSDEYDEKQKLEEQMKAVMDKYKYKRRQIRELQEDLGSMQNTLDTLTRDEQALVETTADKQAKVRGRTGRVVVCMLTIYLSESEAVVYTRQSTFLETGG